MDFPRLVYACPGPIECAGGKTYGQQVVNNAEEHAAALKAGYHDNLADALENKPAPVPVVPRPVVQQSSPEPRPGAAATTLRR